MHCRRTGAAAKVTSHQARLPLLCVRLRSQEGFDGKSPLYVLELYPYTVRTEPEMRRGGLRGETGALCKYFVYGGSK